MSGDPFTSASGGRANVPPLPGAAADPLVGYVLDGKYQIEARVTQTETGVIYRGSNVTIGMTVAIKLMPPALQADPLLVARFERETKLRSQLAHPNCVAVLDHGRDPAGHLYTVMEFVEGRRLTDIIAEGTPLPLSRIVRIASQLVAALEEAHAHGVVHGEVKPFSVQVTNRPADPDFVQLLGFGRLQDALLKGQRFEAEPAYASPEQACGAEVTERSDIYAVGVVLYEMVTGRPPLLGTSEQIVAHHRAGGLIDRPSAVRPDARVDPALEHLIMRCLARDPSHRPESADALGRELLLLVDERGAALGGLTGRISSVAPTISSDMMAAVVTLPPASEAATTGRRGLMVVAIAAMAVLGLGLGVWLVLALGSDQDTAQAESAPASGAQPRDEQPVEPVEVSAGSLESEREASQAAGLGGASGAAASETEEAEPSPGEGAAAPVESEGEPGETALDAAEAAVELELDGVELEDGKDEKRRKKDKRSSGRNDEKRRDTVTQTMLNKAESYLREGNKSGARALVERVLERDPKNRRALALKAKVN